MLVLIAGSCSREPQDQNPMKMPRWQAPMNNGGLIPRIVGVRLPSAPDSNLRIPARGSVLIQGVEGCKACQGL